jgi:hypothetical protein
MTGFNISGFNIADIAVIAIVAIGGILGMKKGIVNMALKVLYSIVSFGASVVFYPMLSAVLRKTGLFTALKTQISGMLGLDSMLQSYTRQQEVGIINSLQLPENVKTGLLENNNADIYKLVGADRLSDYIAGYVANIVLNVVLAWLLFTVFMMALRYVMKVLRIASKLPVIKSANKLGGAAVGALLAVAVIWVAFTLICVFITHSFAYELYGYIDSSTLAKLLYDNNPLLEIILTRLF